MNEIKTDFLKMPIINNNKMQEINELGEQGDNDLFCSKT